MSKLADALVNAASEAAYVQKTGYNEFHKYAYAKEADFLFLVKPILAKFGIAIIPSTKSVERFEVEPTRSGKKQWITRVNMEFSIIVGDESIVVPYVGEGIDSEDKGIYKALTGCTKYFISKLLMIPTGDDPEVPNEQDKEALREETKKKTSEKKGEAEPGNSETERKEPTENPEDVEIRELKNKICAVVGTSYFTDTERLKTHKLLDTTHDRSDLDLILSKAQITRNKRMDAHYAKPPAYDLEKHRGLVLTGARKLPAGDTKKFLKMATDAKTKEEMDAAWTAVDKELALHFTEGTSGT